MVAELQNTVTHMNYSTLQLLDSRDMRLVQKKVKEYIEKYGYPDIVQIRKIFKTTKSCASWESKVLKRLNAANNPKFLNQKNGDELWDTTGKPMAEKARIKLDLYNIAIREKRHAKYYAEPKYCPECNTMLQYAQRKRTYCSGKCGRHSVFKAKYDAYESNPKLCPECGVTMNWSKRRRNFCSHKCQCTNMHKNKVFKFYD